MDRGRILILGQSKETTYEIRNLLDNHRFELEIALTKEVGKQVLCNRKMNLIMIHSEMLKEDEREFFEFLSDRAIQVPVLILGEQTDQITNKHLNAGDVHYFGKPYISADVISCIKKL